MRIQNTPRNSQAVFSWTDQPSIIGEESKKLVFYVEWILLLRAAVQAVQTVSFLISIYHQTHKNSER